MSGTLLLRHNKKYINGSLVHYCSAVLSVAYKFLNANKFSPYIGVGLGVGISETKAEIPGVATVRGTDSDLLYQLLAGLDYSINPQTEFGISYSLSGSEILNPEFKTHSFGATVRYYWNGKQDKKKSKKRL